MERTREIGTLKALGYNRRDILSLFSFESILIGVLGGTLGLLGGFVMGRVLVLAVRFSPNSPEIDAVFLPHDLIAVWIIAVSLSTIAGLYPAWRASRLDPVVALRKE
jgi:putative ABC transport system permease protein